MGKRGDGGGGEYNNIASARGSGSCRRPRRLTYDGRPPSLGGASAVVRRFSFSRKYYSDHSENALGRASARQRRRRRRMPRGKNITQHPVVAAERLCRCSYIAGVRQTSYLRSTMFRTPPPPLTLQQCISRGSSVCLLQLHEERAATVNCTRGRRNSRRRRLGRLQSSWPSSDNAAKCLSFE